MSSSIEKHINVINREVNNWMAPTTLKNSTFVPINTTSNCVQEQLYIILQLPSNIEDENKDENIQTIIDEIETNGTILKVKYCDNNFFRRLSDREKKINIETSGTENCSNANDGYQVTHIKKNLYTVNEIVYDGIEEEPFFALIYKPMANKSVKEYTKNVLTNNVGLDPYASSSIANSLGGRNTRKKNRIKRKRQTRTKKQIKKHKKNMQMNGKRKTAHKKTKKCKMKKRKKHSKKVNV